MSRHRLYPPIEPYNHGILEPEGAHKIYWEECGNPEGIPVIFLHGGPGAGCNPMHRRFFDPQRYRIVLFDQRGCGRSRPIGCLENNTTQSLIEDIERLRELLNVDAWVTFGGSWGSTLALAYGQAHPKHCLALVLRGIFLGRKSELDWFFNGVKHIFPEHQQDLINFLPPEERKDYLANYYRRLCDPDPAVHAPAADVWAKFEARCVTLAPSEEALIQQSSPDESLAISRIEAHFMINSMFLEEAELLSKVDRIKHLPGYIVQGRYDAICPPVSAWELHKAWPNSDLTMLHDAGHSASEPSITRSLVRVMDELKVKLA